MVPPYEHEVSSNGQAAVAEPELTASTGLRTVREHVAQAIDPLQKQLDAKLHELDETLRPVSNNPLRTNL